MWRCIECCDEQLSFCATRVALGVDATLRIESERQLGF